MTVSEVMEKVTRDLPFYKISKGGVTFSGGEPLEQADFLRALLIECKKQNIHTAVDTAGNVSWEEFEKILQYTDLFLYDIKCMDNEKHKQATGAENIRILENLRLIQSAGFQNEIWIRIPIIPGINDNEEEAKKVVNFIREFKGISKIDLLPFHKMGKEKYESLGMEYKAEELLPVSEDVLEKLVQIYRKNGFDANIERG
jgi:pyruvate formate lyase activating enzyme